MRTEAVAEALSELTREHAIRNAAARLFTEKGFEAVSMRELGRAVGIEAPSLYNHFPSKYDLLSDLLIGAMEELIAELRAALSKAPPDPIDQLHTAIRSYVLFHNHRLDETSISDSERRALRPPEAERLLELRDELGRIFKDIIERGEKAGLFVVDDLSLTTICVLSICARLPVWYRPQGRLKLDEIAEVLSRFALRALGAPGVSGRGRKQRKG